MKIEYDPEADASYIYLKHPIADGEVKRVVPVKGTTVVLDFGEADQLLGVEILDVSRVAPSIAREQHGG